MRLLVSFTIWEGGDLMSVVPVELEIAPVEAVVVNDVLSPPKRPELSLVVAEEVSRPKFPKISVAVIAALEVVNKFGWGLAAPMARSYPLLVIMLSPNDVILVKYANHISGWPFLIIATFRLCLADPFQWRIGKYIGDVLDHPGLRPKKRRNALRRFWHWLTTWPRWLKNKLVQPLARFVRRPKCHWWSRLLTKLLCGGWLFFFPSGHVINLIAATNQLKWRTAAVIDVLGTVGKVYVVIFIWGDPTAL